MKQPVLTTSKLTKKYNNFTALDAVDITINQGEICGLIGKNGAGKTTLMKTVTTLVNKTSGSFELFGHKDTDVTETKRRIGCLIESPAFFGGLSGYDNLKYYAIQKGIVDDSQIDKALELVGLLEAKRKKFKNYSLGMKQRLGVAFAILDNPDFLILDEPINGLDPIGISELRETFRKLNKERGVTILISSHILSELYAVADRFIFLNEGKVVKDVTKEQLDIECSKCIVVKTDEVKNAVVAIEEFGSKNFKVIDDFEIRIYDKLDNIRELSKMFIKYNIVLCGLYESGITLEDYFKTLVKDI